MLIPLGECDQGTGGFPVSGNGTGPIVIAGYRQSLTDGADLLYRAPRGRRVAFPGRPHRSSVIHQRLDVAELVPREPCRLKLQHGGGFPIVSLEGPARRSCRKRVRRGELVLVESGDGG